MSSFRLHLHVQSGAAYEAASRGVHLAASAFQCAPVRHWSDHCWRLSDSDRDLPVSYAVTVDPFDAFAQPHCPHCNVVMREHVLGWACPSCRHVDDHSFYLNAVEIPASNDIPGIHGG